MQLLFCNHCRTRVLPMTNGCCPGCQGSLADAQPLEVTAPNPEPRPAPTTRTPPSGSSPSPTAFKPSPESRTGRCDITGRVVNDLQTRYLLVGRQNIGVLTFLTRRISIRTIELEINCSQAAFERGRRIGWMSTLIAVSGFLLFFLAIPGVFLLRTLGVPSGITGTVGLSMMGLSGINVFGGHYLMLGIYRRRSLNALIAEPLNSLLNELVGGKDWGLLTHAGFLKQPSSPESAVPLRNILPQARNGPWVNHFPA
jgi:hypothetical protein